MSDEVTSSLGEKLLLAVQNLWKDVNSQGKVLDHHGQEIEKLKRTLEALQAQVHGLKSSKGKAIATNARLRAAVEESEAKLSQIDGKLN